MKRKSNTFLGVAGFVVDIGRWLIEKLSILASRVSESVADVLCSCHVCEYSVLLHGLFVSCIVYVLFLFLAAVVLELENVLEYIYSFIHILCYSIIMIKKLSGSLRRRSMSSSGSGAAEDGGRTSFASSHVSGASAVSSATGSGIGAADGTNLESTQRSRRHVAGLEELAAAYRRVLADHNAARNEAKAIREARGVLDRKDAHRAPEFKDIDATRIGQIGSTDYKSNYLHHHYRGKDISPKSIRRSGRVVADGLENDKPNPSASCGLKENVVVRMTGSRRSRRHRLSHGTASRAKSMESPSVLKHDQPDRYDGKDRLQFSASLDGAADPRGALRARSMVEPGVNRQGGSSGDIPFFVDDRVHASPFSVDDGTSNMLNGPNGSMKIVEQRRHDPAADSAVSASTAFDKMPRQLSVSKAKPPKKPVNPGDVGAAPSSASVSARLTSNNNFTGAVRRVSGSKGADGAAVEPRTKTVPVMVVAASAADEQYRRGRHPRQQSFAVGDNRAQAAELSALTIGDATAAVVQPDHADVGDSRKPADSTATNSSPLSSASSASTPVSPGYSDRSDPTHHGSSRASSVRTSSQYSATERHRPCRWSVEGAAPEHYSAISQRRDRAEARGLVSACSVLEQEVVAIEERAAEVASNTDEAAFLESRASSLRHALAILEDRYDSIEDFYLKGREYAHAMGRFYQVSPEEYDRWTRRGRPHTRNSVRSGTSSHERAPARSPTNPTLTPVDSMTRMSLR